MKKTIFLITIISAIILILGSCAAPNFVPSTMGENGDVQETLATDLYQPTQIPSGNSVFFQDGFEGGSFGSAWATSGTSNWRVRCYNSTSTTYVHGGSYSALLDVGTNGTYSYSQLTLTQNLTGKTNVYLEFYWKEFNDENHSGDGVFISADGSNWTQAMSFNNGPSTWTLASIDISTAAANAGLTLNSSFKIRFQYYDNYGITSDGYGIDDVSLSSGSGGSSGGSTVTIFQDNFDSSSLGSSWSTEGSGAPRLLVTSSHAPYSSPYHVTMDSSSNGTWTTNGLVLNKDMSSYSNIKVEYYYKEYGDENHSQDGLYIYNGSWTQVKSFNNGPGSYTKFTVDLSAYSNITKIKWQQYDNYGMTSDGVCIDNVKVTGEDGGTPPPSDVLGENHPSSGSYSPYSQSSWGSASWAKGANFSGSNLEIGVYAPSASKVLLEIYNAATGSDAVYDYWMAKGSDGVWRAKLTSMPNKTMYAFRAWGPNWAFSSSWDRGNSSAGFVSDVDASGNRFNPNKVLYDPYTKEMTHDKENPTMTAAGQDGGMYGTGSDLYKGVVRRNYDTGKWAPKSVALMSDGVSYGTKPNIPQKDSITYEAHVKGLTYSSSSSSLTTSLSGIAGFSDVSNVPSSYRGTYKGAGYMAKYLKDLGYTTIELLPIQETANDNNPSGSAGGNYWGYMTYGYFAPDRKYSYDKSLGGPTAEFKSMVKAFHDQGMEVYMDVVYNHTGEGGTWGASDVRELTSMAGFANQYYYRLTGGNAWYYDGTTGCGNQLNCTSGKVGHDLIIDSLTYWIDTMGVDGFRFDLAHVLGREDFNSYSYNGNAQTLQDIQSLGDSRNAEMIAEAWDCEGSDVSSFPSHWGDWNGDYRDVLRGFVKGDGYKPSGSYYSFGDVFYGTYNGYYDGGTGGPQHSVNLLVAHDGFTLTDLVSYNSKNNGGSWPWGPSDGGNDSNKSWDCGGSQSLRRQQIRNFWTLQFFSRGVPITVAGDELCRTQNGNNNPYNIDSELAWNNYGQINTDSPNTVMSSLGQHNNVGTDGKSDGKNGLFLFAKYVIQLRKNHVALRQSNYNMPIYLKKENGTSDLSSTDHCVWARLDGSSVGDHDFLLFINSYSSGVNYTVPTASSGKKWVRIIDTANWAEANDNYWDVASAAEIAAGSYYVNARSTVVFEEVSASGSGGATTVLDEAFGSGIPASWTVTQDGAGNTWGAVNSAAKVQYSSSSTNEDTKLCTPALNLSSYSTVTLKFSEEWKGGYSGVWSDGYVYVSTNGGSTWTQVNHLHHDTGTGEHTDSNNQSLDVSSYASGHSNVKFAWRYNADYDWYWIVDNVQVIGE